jgi:hypothetical protein
MSTIWLSSLVGVGLFLLVIIAYGSHRMEMAKIERMRLAGLHKDRFRNLQFILDVVPAKAMSGDLPLLITRSMAMHMQKVIDLQGESSDIRHHLEHAKKLQEKVAKGEVIASKSSNGTLQERLKEVRRATKLLKDFILQQHRGGFLSKPVASQYIKSLQEINLVATIDGILGQASHSLGEGKKSTALRYFQLALQEIRKSRNPSALAEQSKVCTESIKRLKADQKAVAEVAQELNQQLAKSIAPKPDDKDDDEFDMRQTN